MKEKTHMPLSLRSLGIAAVGMIPCVLVAISARASTSSSSASRNVQTASDVAKTPPSIVTSWVAFGSGCPKTSSAQPSQSAELTSLPPRPGEPETRRIRVRLPQYRLDLTGTAGEAPLEGPRECAFRINVNPPQGRRIRNVTSRALVNVSKTEKSSLVVHSALRLGATTLGQATFDFPPGRSVSRREEEFVLFPGRSPEEQFPATRCGEGRVVGLDFTFIGKRPDRGERVDAALGRDKDAEIVVDLEECRS